MTQDEAKALVGERAAQMVEDGMAVGLGTGTTSVMFIKALGDRVQQGLKIRCVASSDSSTELGRSLGMDVVTLEQLPELDLYVDGADEVCVEPGAGLYLIKGGGAALLREKIVASAANRFVCVVDESKIVNKLGKFPLPVEIIKMARPLVEPRLAELGLHPKLRMKKDAVGTGPYGREQLDPRLRLWRDSESGRNGSRDSIHCRRRGTRAVSRDGGDGAGRRRRWRA